MTINSKDVPSYEELGRNIIWDYAAYGMPFRQDEIPEHLREDFQGVYDYALKQIGKSKPNDKYIRKWLQLRFHAWLRDKYFAPDVTPEALKVLDYSFCPITRQPLTYGTLQDTDWSIDRINNNGAYALGNLVVMSVKANKAKNNLGFKELCDNAANETPPLSFMEWMRLAVLAHEVSDDQEIMPFPCLVPGIVSLNVPQQLQFYLTIFSGRWSILAETQKYIKGKKAGKYFKDMAEFINDVYYKQIKDNSDGTPFDYAMELQDMWVANESLRVAFTKFCHKTTEDDKGNILEAIRKIGFYKKHRKAAPTIDLSLWKTETNGYNV